MVVGALSDQLVAVLGQAGAQRARVGLDLLLVRLELRRAGVLQRNSQRSDLVVVGAALQGGEDGCVDALLVVKGAALRLALLQVGGRLGALHSN